MNRCSSRATISARPMLSPHGADRKRPKRMTTIDRQAAYTGTKEVAAPLRFDAARLEGYLAANAKGFQGPLHVTQFRGGQPTPTYMLETPERKYRSEERRVGKECRS